MMIKTIAAAALIAGLASAAGAANLVVNGNFDADVTATKINFQGNVTGWSGGGNLTFLAPPGSADDGNQYLAVYGPFPNASPAGGNFILADGDPNFSGAFSQTISNLTIGKAYVVSFYQAAGQQLGFTGPTTEQWRVSFGDESQFSSLFELPEAGVGEWQAQSLTFTATASSQVLTFLATGTPGGAPPISFLDGVTLTAVPEPATWAMMVGGFGLVGFAARRRRGNFAAV